jgi:hypothetical protein
MEQVSGIRGLKELLKRRWPRRGKRIGATVACKPRLHSTAADAARYRRMFQCLWEGFRASAYTNICHLTFVI